MTSEEKRAQLIIKYRGFEVEEVEEKDGMMVYYMESDGKKLIMHVLLGESTIGIAYVRQLRDALEEEDADGGLIVGDGKYTYSARSNAPGMNIELIPATIPTFDIFEHDIVPLHEIVSEEKKKELVKTYHAEPYQFPWIKSDDPISVILGAKPGDILKITQKSETAGISESYRYVV